MKGTYMIYSANSHPTSRLLNPDANGNLVEVKNVLSWNSETKTAFIVVMSQNKCLLSKGHVVAAEVQLMGAIIETKIGDKYELIKS